MSWSGGGWRSLPTSCGKTQGGKPESLKILWLFRSPLYDTRSKAVIVSILQFSQNNIPLVGTVSKALLKYLHEYQQMYFYTWGK